jgi:hypothetical protein
MTINNALYESVSDSATELVLQPRSSRDRIMRRAWFESILFITLGLPILTIVPPMFITAIASTILGSFAPGFGNAGFLIAWFAAMAKFGWDILQYFSFKNC